MSEHLATIRWQRTSADFSYDTYNRAHEWSFDSGVIVPASAALEYHGEPERVDPEEALVAALSGCHMLTFLTIAARKRFVVDAYTDHAVGVMTKNEQGKPWVSRVTLRPAVVFSGPKQPDADQLRALHKAAHENCFIALSVKSEVIVEPQ